MAKQFPALLDTHQAFIARQHIFFTASAAETGRVNISPRGTEHFRVLSPNRVAYLDLTGSGNETSAHLRATGRLTIMFCAFDGPPVILRLYGQGRVLLAGTPDYTGLLATAFDGKAPLGARQIIVLDADLIQTSCGFGVPLFEHTADRDTLDRWAEAKGADGIVAYRAEKNRVSIDGFPAWDDEVG